MTDTDEEGQPKEVLSAKISHQAANGWRDFCGHHGISVSALLEVAGRELAAETMPPTEEARIRMVKAARQIDQQRRSRKRPPKAS